MTKIKKTETVEEFLARGGKVVVLPPEEPEDNKHVVKPTAGGLPQLMTLADGEHFFGETRKKKKKQVTTEEFKNKVSNMNLPADVVASLINSVGAKKNEQ